MKLTPLQFRKLIKQEYSKFNKKKINEMVETDSDELLNAMMSYLDGILTQGATLEEACQDLMNKAHEACDKWSEDMSAQVKFAAAAE